MGDSVPGVMRWSVDTRSHHEMRDKMMDLKARSSPQAESGQVCASVPVFQALEENFN